MATKSTWYPVLLTATGIALAGGAYYYFVWRPKQAGKITPVEEGGSGGGGGGGGLVGGNAEPMAATQPAQTTQVAQPARRQETGGVGYAQSQISLIKPTFKPTWNKLPLRAAVKIPSFSVHTNIV